MAKYIDFFEHIGDLELKSCECVNCTNTIWSTSKFLYTGRVNHYKRMEYCFWENDPERPIKWGWYATGNGKCTWNKSKYGRLDGRKLLCEFDGQFDGGGPANGKLKYGDGTNYNGNFRKYYDEIYEWW